MNKPKNYKRNCNLQDLALNDNVSLYGLSKKSGEFEKILEAKIIGIHFNEDDNDTIRIETFENAYTMELVCIDKNKFECGYEWYFYFDNYQLRKY